MTQLGGHAVYLTPSDIRLGERESVADIARNLERWVDLIMARTFAHETLVELARHARVPVINGLSDLRHPCQVLADCFTLLEHRGRLDGLRVAFIGDGNNVANSWIDAGGALRLRPSRSPARRATSPTPALVAAARQARRQRRSSPTTSPTAARRRRRRSTPTSGPAWARRPRRERAPQRLRSATRSTTRCCARAKPDARGHALPAGAPRRGDHRRGASTARTRSSSTRPRTACTCRRPSWCGCTSRRAE